MRVCEFMIALVSLAFAWWDEDFSQEMGSRVCAISLHTPFMLPLAPGGPDPPTAAAATSAAIDAAMMLWSEFCWLLSPMNVSHTTMCFTLSQADRTEQNRPCVSMNL